MERHVVTATPRLTASKSRLRRVVRAIVPRQARHHLRTFIPKIRLLNFYDAFRRAPIASAKYLLFNREIDNFTYELANEVELAQFLGRTLGITPDEATGYIDELQGDDSLRAAIREHLSHRADRNRTMPYGRRLGWYAATRARKARTIVETGVHDGLGSTVLLQALKRNAADGFDGRLISFDINPDAGWLIPSDLRSRHELHVGNSLDLMVPALDGREVNLFIHDSDHRYGHETAEFEAILEVASQGAVLISDNAHAGTAFRDFCERHRLRFHLFMEVPVDHFYRGAGIGLTLMDSIRDREPNATERQAEVNSAGSL
jgi:predicted O-methyltransferase YrrM